MEGKLVSQTFLIKDESEGGTTEKSTPFSYSEYIKSYCSFYMSIGMSYEEYWHGDNDAPQYYYKAYKLKKRMENERLWLQGLYNYNALVSASPCFNSFKPRDPIKYMDNPMAIDEDMKRELAERDNQIAKETAMADFKGFVTRFNDSRKEIQSE